MDEGFILKKVISEHLSSNKNKYLLFSALLILGIISGIICYKYLPTTEIDKLKQFIGDYINYLSGGEIIKNTGDYFQNNLWKEIKIFGLLWLCGLIGAGKVVSCAYILFEGFTLGFTSTVFVNAYQLEGVFFNLIGLIPQNIIKIPSLLFALVCMWSVTAKYKTKISANKRDLMNIVFIYTLLIICAFCVCVISIFFESYILPYLMVFISKQML